MKLLVMARMIPMYLFSSNTTTNTSTADNVFKNTSAPIINLINAAVNPLLGIVGALGALYCILLGAKAGQGRGTAGQRKSKTGTEKCGHRLCTDFRSAGCTEGWHAGSDNLVYVTEFLINNCPAEADIPKGKEDSRYACEKMDRGYDAALHADDFRLFLLLKTVDLNAAQVSPAVQTLPYTPEENTSKTASQGNDRYSKVDGPSAFYILRNNCPVASTMIDFKLVAMLQSSGETTFYYAYQALCMSADNNGLGSESETGTAPAADTKNYEGGTGSPLQQMNTVFMSYNVKTRAYKVFYHIMEAYDPKTMKPLWSDKSTAGNDDAKKASELKSFFVHRYINAQGNDAFFFYYNGYVYSFKTDGSVFYQWDLNAILTMSSQEVGGTGARYSVEEVLPDSNNYIYVSMLIEKSDSNIDENTDDEDIDSADSGVQQVLFTLFHADVSESDQAISLLNPNSQEYNPAAYDKLSQKSYFISQNQSYAAQKKAYQDDVNNKGFWKSNPPPTGAQVVAANKDDFGTYSYSSSELNMDLYSYEGTPSFWGYNGINWWNEKKMVASKPSFFSKLRGGARIVTDLTYHFAGKTVTAEGLTSKLFFFQNIKRYPIQREEDILLTRSYWLKYYTDYKIGSITIQVLNYENHTDSYTFHVAFTLHFCSPDGLINYYTHRLESGTLSQSDGDGIILYGLNSSDDPDADPSSNVTWETSDGKFYQSYLNGNVNSASIYRDDDSYEEEGPILFIYTDVGIYMLTNIAKKPAGSNRWAPAESSDKGSLVPHTKLNFGLALGKSDAAALGTLNEIAVPNEQETPSFTKVSTQENADTFNEMSCFRQKEDDQDFLYVAGLANGIVKAKITTNPADTDKATSAQVSPYPYYAIWNDKKGDKKSIYALGYQSGQYTYAQTDICCAKLYTVSLKDQTAAANMVVSAVSKVPAAAKDTASWNEMIGNLGLKDADLKKADIYKEFLMDGKDKQTAAKKEFFALTGLTEPSAGSESTLLTELFACRYSTDLETLMAKYLPELTKNSGLKVTDKEYTTNASDVSVPSTAEISAGATVGSFTAGSSDLTKAAKQLELDSSSKEAIDNVRYALMQKNNLTLAEWTDRLNEIAYHLQLADTIEKFYRKRAALLFSTMAETSVNGQTEAEVKACKSAADLEELMASGKTVLSQKPEERKKQIAEAVQECRDQYVLKAYDTDTTGQKIYWKTKTGYGDKWNNEAWLAKWNKDLASILSDMKQGGD